MSYNSALNVDDAAIQKLQLLKAKKTQCFQTNNKSRKIPLVLPMEIEEMIYFSKRLSNWKAKTYERVYQILHPWT